MTVSAPGLSKVRSIKSAIALYSLQVQVIAGVVFRQDVLGVARIAGGGIEIDPTIEGAAAADPGIHRPALLFLVLVVVAIERGAMERILERGQGRAVSSRWC